MSSFSNRSFTLWELFALLWLPHFVDHLWPPWRCTPQIFLQAEPAGRNSGNWQTPGDNLWNPLQHSAQALAQWRLPGSDWAWSGSRPVILPGGDTPVGWLRLPLTSLQSEVLIAFFPSPSPFKAVRPASQTEGSPCLLLFPLPFVFHRGYPPSPKLLTLSWPLLPRD